MNIVPNLLVVSGLPCIGKTQMLELWCRRAKVNFIQYDKLRQTWLPRTEFCGEMVRVAGQVFSGFPLTAQEYSSLLYSRENFLSFYAWQAERFGSLLKCLIRTQQLQDASATVLELSPFVLAELTIQAPILMCSVERALHVQRLRQRLGCGHAAACHAQAFLNQALAEVESRIQYDYPLCLPALPSALAQWRAELVVP